MANAYLVPGGNGIINSSTNWSTTSGGPSGYAPLSTDDLIVDANSLNAPLTTAAVTYNSLTFTNYTGVFTMSSAMTLSSTLIYSTGMTTAGTAIISVGASALSTATINFNGVVHSGGFQFNNGSSAITTYAITGDMDVMGVVQVSNGNLGGAGVKITLNQTLPTRGRINCNAGFSIFGNGNRRVNTSGGGMDFWFVGTGTGNFTSGVNAYFVGVNIYLAKTGGSVTMTSGAIYSRTQTITYISGTFIAFNLICNINAITLNTNSFVWSTINIGASTTVFTQLSELRATTLIWSVNDYMYGAFDVYVGTFTIGSTMGIAINKTVYIATAFNSVATAASNFNISSNVPGTRTKITLAPNATQDVAHTNAIDIDSSGGKTIYSYRVVTLTNTLNWATLPIITTVNTKSIIQ